MKTSPIVFPRTHTRTLLWGGATASSQYEGAYAAGGKGLDTQDCRPYLPRTSNATTETRLLTQAVINTARASAHADTPASAQPFSFYPFRTGSDGYHHLEEDITLLAELGIDIYRFSISWARLFPTGDESEPNPAGLAYYDRVFSAVRAAGMKVFLTLTHYAMPLAIVEDHGGWTQRDTIERYVRFARVVFERWGDTIDYYLPFNEINAGYFSPWNGVGLPKPEAGPYDQSLVFQSLHHQFVASARVIELQRRIAPHCQSGCMVADFCYYPHTCSPEDNLATVRAEQVNQWLAVDVLARGFYPSYIDRFFAEEGISITVMPDDLDLLTRYTCDFVSISYYQSSVYSTDETAEQTAGNLVSSVKNPYLAATDWGWQIDPVGLRTALNKLYDRVQKPIFISENGMGSRDALARDTDGNPCVHDPYRTDYLARHFEQIDEAVRDGVDLIGYIMWGVIDIVSAGSCEMEKRYGVVYVDADNEGCGTYNRFKKDSFAWYQRFIATYHETGDVNASLQSAHEHGKITQRERYANRMPMPSRT